MQSSLQARYDCCMDEQVSISLRMPRATLEAIDAAARAQGMDRSNYLRAAALEKAQGGAVQPVTTGTTHAVDTEARAALEKLLERIKGIEVELEKREKAVRERFPTLYEQLGDDFSQPTDPFLEKFG